MIKCMSVNAQHSVGSWQAFDISSLVLLTCFLFSLSLIIIEYLRAIGKILKQLSNIIIAFFKGNYSM